MSNTVEATYFYEIAYEGFGKSLELLEFAQMVLHQTSPAEYDNNNNVVYRNVQEQYKNKLLRLGFQPTTDDDSTWTLSMSHFNSFSKMFIKARTDCHYDSQVAFIKHTKEVIGIVNTPLNITHEQRLILFKEYIHSTSENNGSLVLCQKLYTLFKLQLKEKQYLIEWKLGYYTLYHGGDLEFIDQTVRLLKGVLGMPTVYRDDDDHQVVVEMEHTDPRYEEPILHLRMNPELNDQMISDFIKCIPSKYRNFLNNDMQVSDVKRLAQSKPSIFQWIYQILSHYLSFLQNK